MSNQTEEIREERDKKVGGIMKYFNLIMGGFYLVLAAVMYFYPIIENIDTWAKIGLSTLLAFYGGFRIWRALQA